ncbi:dihydrofolate reductase family protein [Chitinophaga rhizophila]|uniref:Dihydrofolate reductase family protein n=1 Tax=Chitinophaga rhizophila TaxID=2866212 RepID=A0ABS7GA73_9BACT|nr:dihydrofolate reductase family protein [Chitinophaga rhizophila]MBW8684195.1 dihydrofolate reductase family protein [Chitinophaga rhizophila]
MRKIILYIAISLDGFIARKDDDIKWLTEFPYPENDDYGYADLLSRIDTTIMGNATYSVVRDSLEPWPYGDKMSYIFTRSAAGEDTDNIKFIRNDIPAFIDHLQQTPGKDIWLIGGGKLNTLFLQHDWIDEMIIHVIPVIIGEGISLFEGSTFERRFKLEETQTYSTGVVMLRYSRQNT